jgi:hypothetical protein
MELNITEFFRAADPFSYSASKAEMGDNAGSATYQAACNADFQILTTDEQRTAFRAFVAESGGWDEEEINEWSDSELNALCIQWVSGDMREPVGFELGPDTTDEQWQEYERQCEQGQCSGRIYRGTDGQVYFYIGR